MENNCGLKECCANANTQVCKKDCGIECYKPKEIENKEIKKKMNIKQMNVKQIWRYGRGRIIVTGYSFSIAFLWCDVFNLPYWMMALWFIPVNFCIGYLINKNAFKIK